MLHPRVLRVLYPSKNSCCRQLEQKFYNSLVTRHRAAQARKPVASSRRAPKARQRAAINLDRMTDRQLLELRLCDLPLRIRGTRLEQRVEKLYRELEARSLAL